MKIGWCKGVGYIIKTKVLIKEQWFKDEGTMPIDRIERSQVLIKSE